MIEIIPAIDIIGGKCVRLTQGDYDTSKTYYDDPLEIALRFRDAGLTRLHMVDLDGAKASSPVNLRTLDKVATATGMDIQYGGGIKSRRALADVFGAGASRAICGSIAVTEPESFRSWLADFGPSKIILGADVKDGFIATHGWLESSGLTIETLIDKFISDGLDQVICTDISKDGMLSGPNFSLYEDLQKVYEVINITISGGVSSMDDIFTLDKAGMRSVIVGKAIYEGFITLPQIADFVGSDKKNR